jgi:hypothetical protein
MGGLRMIGDAEIRVPPLPRGVGHLLERVYAVRKHRMQVKHATQIF